MSADITIFYVTNPLRSVRFYSALFNIQPVEASPTFALFIFESGFKLGLWSSFTVEPLPVLPLSSNTGEIVFMVKSREKVDALYNVWGSKHEVTIIQKPVSLDFGYAFTAIDPDGHRLRVCFLEEE